MAINVKEKTSKRQVEAHRLRYEVGLTYVEIAETLSYSSKSAAYNAVQAAIKIYDVQRADTVTQSRDAAVARLEQYINDLQSKLGSGMNVITTSDGPKGKTTSNTYIESDELKVYDKILKAEAALAKLQGTNQEKPEVTVNIMTHEERLKELQ